MLTLSGDGLWLMLIHFPTGGVAVGVFAGNFFWGFIFFFSLCYLIKDPPWDLVLGSFSLICNHSTGPSLKVKCLSEKRP